MGAPIRQAMLMAAGLGTRLRPFTDQVPKALLPVMGVPMAQFALDSLARAGVTRVVANVHHLAPIARAGLLALERPASMEIIISDESGLLLGSAGGLREALPYFGGEPFYLVNADVICDVDLAALGRAHLRRRTQWGAALTLAVCPQAPPGSAYREILVDPAEGRVIGFAPHAHERPFFIGSAVIEPDALARVPREGAAEFVPTILEPAIAEGRACAALTRPRWHDVGSPALWLDAHLALIEALETGALSRGLRERIESRARRLADRVWGEIGARELAFPAPPSFVGSAAGYRVTPHAISYGGMSWAHPVADPSAH